MKLLAAADAVNHVELGRRADVPLAVQPQHRPPVVPVGRMHLAEGRRHQLDVRERLHGGVDHPEEHFRVELRFGLLRDLGALHTEPLLQVLLVADQAVDMGDDSSHRLDGPLLAAGRLPQLGPEIQVERGDGARGLGRFHPLDDEFARGLGQGREDAANEAYLAATGAADMAMMVTDRAVQILGGHGYIREHPVEMWMRNGRGFAMFTGLAIV